MKQIILTTLMLSSAFSGEHQQPKYHDEKVMALLEKYSQKFEDRKQETDKDKEEKENESESHPYKSTHTVNILSAAQKSQHMIKNFQARQKDIAEEIQALITKKQEENTQEQELLESLQKENTNPSKSFNQKTKRTKSDKNPLSKIDDKIKTIQSGIDGNKKDIEYYKEWVKNFTDISTNNLDNIGETSTENLNNLLQKGLHKLSITELQDVFNKLKTQLTNHKKNNKFFESDKILSFLEESEYALQDIINIKKSESKNKTSEENEESTRILAKQNNHDTKEHAEQENQFMQAMIQNHIVQEMKQNQINQRKPSLPLKTPESNESPVKKIPKPKINKLSEEKNG